MDVEHIRSAHVVRSELAKVSLIEHDSVGHADAPEPGRHHTKDQGEVGGASSMEDPSADSFPQREDPSAHTYAQCAQWTFTQNTCTCACGHQATASKAGHGTRQGAKVVTDEGVDIHLALPPPPPFPTRTHHSQTQHNNLHPCTAIGDTVGEGLTP